MKSTNTDEVAKELNENVIAVIGSENIKGFQKAFLIASATGRLKTLLTPDYMRPIMDLQGNRLGFKTDRDVINGQPANGYPEAIVKNCLIEAVLTGVQPFGNQFNIIAGNMYITKEGFGYLLANYPGLYYEITFDLPRINQEKTSAAVVANIEWKIGANEKKTKKLDLPVKMNQYMGADAVLGKAQRKARAWLYNTITGSEIGDGDATDIDAKVLSSKLNDEIPSFEDLEMLYEMKKEFLNAEDRVLADRVISTKEIASYSKLYKFLQSK